MRALVTGGAGFIGSHLVDALVARGDEVRVLDDFFTGSRANLNPAAEVYEGSVADEELARRACEGCEVVFHLAAHKAVLRSVEHPLPTDLANTHGTLTVLEAARARGVRRVVYASSSSVYGGTAPVPTREDAPTVPRSPYAVSKLAGEHYCRVYHELYGLETVSLRYFNVYGPRQRPDGAYAAVVPLFLRALLDGDRPVVHGDGHQARDFTYVTDVVDANLRAASAPASRCAGRVYNVARGVETSVLELLAAAARVAGVEAEPEFAPARAGDVRRSRGDAGAAARDLDVRCEIDLETGLARTLDALRRHG
ncbi:MAG: UDP-glucose 4-epimerase-like protein [Acidimicrobiia bacterium]|nr:MAG: UDP-glucose 4-epimerase-like protein [Acidimicrobiia bacterium]